MGVDRRKSEQDTRKREEQFEELRQVGGLLNGVREREPLPEGERDEA